MRMMTNLAPVLYSFYGKGMPLGESELDIDALECAETADQRQWSSTCTLIRAIAKTQSL